MASTLIVEDGTGLATADSYLSSANADSYHLKMGNAAWAALSDDQKDAALRAATQYIDSNYTFRGVQLTYQVINGVPTIPQALQFPRNDGCGFLVYPLGGPWPIKGLSQATAELALRASTAGLYQDFDKGDVLEVTVGPISKRYQATGLMGQKQYRIVDSLLRGLTAGGALNSRIEVA